MIPDSESENSSNGRHGFMTALTLSLIHIFYEQVQAYTREYIDNQYACGDGGWIHYRITCREHFDDIQKLLAVKCS